MLRRFFGVKCYSVKEKRIFYKYKSELDSRYIIAEFANSPIGTAWVLTEELKLSDDIRHPPLAGELKEMVESIMICLNGVYDLSYDDWEVGFRKDADINRNIAQWWFLSNRFKKIQDSMILDQGDKKNLFRMMMAIMNNGKEFAISNLTYSGEVERKKTELVNKFTCSDKDFA
jgi:hypothetical protein